MLYKEAMTETETPFFKQPTPRALRALKFFGFVIATIVLFTSLLLWRLKVAPLDLAFAKPYIEASLSSNDAGISAAADRVILYLPGFNAPLFLGLQNVRLTDAQGKNILAVDEAALSLSFSRLLTGRIAPRQIILRKPVLRVLRTVDNQIDFGFSQDRTFDAEEVAAQAEKQETLTARVLRFIAQPGEQAERTPLASLKVFRIEEASVLIEDHALGISWFLPRFDANFQSTKTGLSAGLYLAMPPVAGKASDVNAKIDYLWETKMTTASLDVRNMALRMLTGKIEGMPFLEDQDIVFSGRVDLFLDEALKPEAARMSLFAPQGELNLPGLYTEKLPYKDFAFEAIYDAKRQLLEVSKGQITARDAAINLQGRLTHDAASAGGKVRIWLDNLPQEKIAPLWPEILRGDNSEEWLVHNITGGVYRHAEAEIDIAAAKGEAGWSVDVPQMTAAFDFEGMTVSYRPPLMPVTEGKGRGTFNYKEEKLRVEVAGGKLGDMNITGGVVELVNIIEEGKGIADIHMKINGPAKTALVYASDEPIDIDKQVDFDIAKVKGNADLTVNVNFPTIDDVKMEQFKIDITGILTDMYVPDVLQGLALTDGPFDLKVTHELASLKGKGKLQGRDIDVEWMEHMVAAGKPFAGKIKASLNVDPNLRQHFGVILDDFIEGSVPITAVYTSYADGRAVADVGANLAPVRFFAEPFDYEKPVGQAGSASFKVHFKNGTPVAVSDLVAQAPEFKLESTSLAFRESAPGKIDLASGKISRFTLGETVAGAEFEITPAGQIKIVASGPFFDLRPFLDDRDKDQSEAYEEPPVVVSLTADAMRTSDGQTVQYGKLYVDIDAEGHFNQLEMDAIVGKGDLYLRFKPDETGKRIFRLEAGDAGATLRAFDIYDNIVGGTMLAYGEPARSVHDRNLRGVAEIRNFTAVKTPVLAQLLSILSLTGILELLNNQGLAFEKLETNFDWLYRKRGGILVLKDGGTSGSSIGLTFDGTFDKEKGTLDVAGTIIPMSEVNSIIRSIPLIGDILTGGSGGVFAATYTIKGDAREPQVFVNPLSVLTPGILRRILFEKN